VSHYQVEIPSSKWWELYIHHQQSKSKDNILENYSPVPISATIVNGDEPKLLAQHPRLFMPLSAPMVGTMTAVLQTPVSQPKLVELAIRILPEHEDQKLHA
jgi:hypothetical protein